MAVAYSKWQINNQGYYVRMKANTTEIVAVDLVNQLATTDQLIRAETITDTGINITATVVRYDTAIKSTPHQVLCYIQASQPGVYGIQLKATTNQGLTIVKHFDVLVER